MTNENPIIVKDMKYYLFHPKFKEYFNYRYKSFLFMVRSHEESEIVNKRMDFIKNIHKFLNSEDITVFDRKALEIFLTNTNEYSDAEISLMLNYFDQVENEFQDSHVYQILSTYEEVFVRLELQDCIDKDLSVIKYIENFLKNRFALLKPNKSITVTGLEFDSTDDIKSLEEATQIKYKSCLTGLNELFPGKGYSPNQIVVLSGIPGGRKSLFSMNEILNFIKQGGKVCHILVGNDLDKKDVNLRFMGIFYKLDQWKVYERKDELRLKLKEDFPQLFDHNIYKLIHLQPNEVAASKLVTLLDDNGFLDKYDIFVIDYDAHFLTEVEGNSYENSGEIYTEITKISGRNSNIVFLISQLNKSSWDKESIPLEALAESSKKQQIADTVITIGRYKGSSDNIIGKFNVVKNRRGEIGEFPYLSLPSGRFVNISISEYDTFKTKIKMTDEKYDSVIMGRMTNGISNGS